MSAAPSTYSDRVRCSSCNGSGTTGEHGCTDCLGKGLDHMAFVGGIDQALNDAYAEGRKDQSEADHLSNAAAVLIDAWVAQHGRQISWEKAVEITAIVTKMPDAERARLLSLSEAE